MRPAPIHLDLRAVLVAASIDATAVQQALPEVDLETVTFRIMSRWMRFFLRKTIAAMTLPSGIYLRPDVPEGYAPRSLGRLVVHELVHVRQWNTLGVPRFLMRYVVDYLRGRLSGKGHDDAYLDIGLEVEARAVAARILD